MTRSQWPDPLTSPSLGLRCWPQWRGWRHCPQTGDLIDPNGQAYSPRTIQAAHLMLQLHEHRNRAVFADSGPPRPLLASHDMADSDGSLRSAKKRFRAAMRAALRLVAS
jgi:hypothetical protein